MNKYATVLVAGLALAGVLRADEPKPTFRTEPVKKGALNVTVSVSGTLEPEEVVDVGAQVSGRVVQFGKDPGDPKKTVDYRTPVEKGTVLAVLDDTAARAAVGTARAALAVAEAKLAEKKAALTAAERDWTRAQRLRTSGNLAESDFEVSRGNFETAKALVAVAEAEVGLARATLTEAETNLAYTVIKSPVKGVIIDRRVNVGQTVQASLSAESLFLVAKDLRRMTVWASVPEAEIGRVKKGQEATFTVDPFPGEVFKGVVTKVRLNAQKTQHVVTYTVEIGVDNADEKLLPYLTADVRIAADKKETVRMVHNEALRYRPPARYVAVDYRDAYREVLRLELTTGLTDKSAKPPTVPLVWVEEGGALKPVRVRLGATDGKFTEVLSDNLAEGTKVVVGE
jgi:HlyD family secretion protein